MSGGNYDQVLIHAFFKTFPELYRLTKFAVDDRYSSFSFEANENMRKTYLKMTHDEINPNNL
jgi:hypothetical protein